MKNKSLTSIFAIILLSAACAAAGDSALEANGFGPVRIGADIKKLPASSAGLYDKIVSEKVEEFDYEGVEYHLMLNGEKIATLIEDGGKIHAIEVFSDKVRTADGFGLNKTAAEILAAGGTAYCDNYGFEGLLFRGMLFSYIDLSPSGEKKAETAYLEGTDQTFGEDDFKSGARPGKITLTAWYATQ